MFRRNFEFVQVQVPTLTVRQRIRHDSYTIQVGLIWTVVCLSWKLFTCLFSIQYIWQQYNIYICYLSYRAVKFLDCWQEIASQEYLDMFTEEIILFCSRTRSHCFFKKGTLSFRKGRTCSRRLSPHPSAVLYWYMGRCGFNEWEQCCFFTMYYFSKMHDNS